MAAKAMQYPIRRSGWRVARAASPREASGIAPGAPIGGCDPLHAVSNAAAAQMLSAK